MKKVDLNEYINDLAHAKSLKRVGVYKTVKL